LFIPVFTIRVKWQIQSSTAHRFYLKVRPAITLQTILAPFPVHLHTTTTCYAFNIDGITNLTLSIPYRPVLTMGSTSNYFQMADMQSLVLRKVGLTIQCISSSSSFQAILCCTSTLHGATKNSQPDGTSIRWRHELLVPDSARTERLPESEFPPMPTPQTRQRRFHQCPHRGTQL
jgi:hypothetical protein